MPEPAAARRAPHGDRKDKPAKFTTVAAALRKGRLALSADDQLTRIPRGFEALKGGPLDGAIRLKSFIVEEPLADKLIATPKLAGRDRRFRRPRAMPLLKFGWAALG